MTRTQLTESRFSDSGRSGTGLAITIALHIGVAALALAGLGVIKAPKRIPDPIIITQVPDPVRAPVPHVPPTTEQVIGVDLAEPVIEITQYPANGEPVVIVPQAGSGTSGIETPPVPAGPTRAARFDPRHASAAQPPYPASARRMGEEGTVVVHVRIGPDGRVLESTLAQSSGSPRLDAAALSHALAHWRFTPTQKDGVAVEESRDITVRFQLALAG